MPSTVTAHHFRLPDLSPLHPKQTDGPAPLLSCLANSSVTFQAHRTQEATPLGDGEASGKPSRQRPRSAQDRGGRNRVPLGARRGPERGGCGDPRALGAWPALCCRVRARPAPGQERHL
ncbi:uncharacterized protein LOC128311599 isoform X2 [Acinonyx jubatus]|uniref:Uncharacterized protein LOC128311599 isoform X2 n=1 Tax=Acinonyx jubatus TaxID=32536 RepID=A0ABM3NFX3_ACIJB|nr:uncharacterized protein LOC128311599 isoform X2 [Acinonyx jubatus]